MAFGGDVTVIFVKCDVLVRWDALEVLLIVVSARETISGSFERVLLLLGVFGVIRFGEFLGELFGELVGENWLAVDFLFVLIEFVPLTIVIEEPALVRFVNIGPDYFDTLGLRSCTVATSKFLFEALTLGEVGSAGRKDVRLLIKLAASSTSAVISLSSKAKPGLFYILFLFI